MRSIYSDVYKVGERKKNGGGGEEGTLLVVLEFVKHFK